MIKVSYVSHKHNHLPLNVDSEIQVIMCDMSGVIILASEVIWVTGGFKTLKSSFLSKLLMFKVMYIGWVILSIIMKY